MESHVNSNVVLQPVESDSGTYECQILYLDNDKDIQNVVSSATVNVTGKETASSFRYRDQTYSLPFFFFFFFAIRYLFGS